ncbi:ribonuclease P protein subunit p29-like [Oculina patagonica]
MADMRRVADVSAATLYAGLPDRVKHKMEELGLQPLNCSATSYVYSFTTRVVQNNTDQLGSKMQCDPVMLDRLNKHKNKSNKKPKRKEMSAREKRRRGIFKISPKNQRYDMYLPLHELWKGYMQEMLNLTSGNSNLKIMYPKLLRADYHGCILNVSQSKCPSYVGTCGILLQETKNAFKIITKDDKLKMIPKAHSVFTFELEGFMFTIHGNHFRYRSSERSARKFKPKPTTDL